MTDRTHDEDPPAPGDRTRDITLPPPADPTQPALPHGRPSPLDAPTTAVAGPVAPPPPRAVEVDPAAEEARRLARSRTDELRSQPRAGVRQRTLAFSSPEMQHRPIEPVTVDRTPRRWPWVVLTLLPIVVILASAVGWLVLLRGS
ncbi:hypothetical protein DQ239_08475 [Blastococcus sp. TF02-09]|uniref:hypothetical protein n=1 Tax=Blastococcus sp. TF02-09 TaxID=2250576 RepID=UPI000DEB3249|nr:hypothetical protein [Blastococcus sp. TF02-9]RBY78573.1 hypothetical protein DQ239_08475 [Blastococcus sp. TF02-9]